MQTAWSAYVCPTWTTSGGSVRCGSGDATASTVVCVTAVATTAYSTTETATTGHAPSSVRSTSSAVAGSAVTVTPSAASGICASEIAVGRPAGKLSTSPGAGSTTCTSDDPRPTLTPPSVYVRLDHAAYESTGCPCSHPNAGA